MKTEYIISAALLLSALLLFGAYALLGRRLKRKDRILAQANFHIKEKDFKQAEDFLERVPSEFSKDKDVLYIFGYVKYKINEKTDALRLFLSGNSFFRPHVKYSLGHMYFHNEEDPGKALQLLKNASRNKKTAKEALYTLGLLHYSMGNTKAAEKEIIKSLSKGAKNEDLIDNALGLIYMKDGSFADAVSSFRSSILKNDGSPEVYLNLAEAHARNNEPKEELSILQRAERTHPQNKFVRLKLAEAYTSRGEFDPALINLNAAIKLDPSFAQAYLARAFMYKKMGNDEKYKEDYGKAISFGPDLSVIKT